MTALAALAAAMLVGVWAFVIELNRLVVTRCDIELAGLPESFDGMRVVAISDLHMGSRFAGEGKLERVVRSANEQNADLVVLLGDYVAGNSRRPATFPHAVLSKQLGQLRARHGVYAVMGNHDYWSGVQPIIDALRKAGIRVIDSSVAPVERGSDRIWLLGVSDRWARPRTDFEAYFTPEIRASTVIAITHNPDVFPELKPPVPLLLAGHTHGGQVWLPYFGRPIVPSKFGQRYAAGLVKENGRQIYVTTGVGTSIFPVRFLVPPEIAVLTLRRAGSGSGTTSRPELPVAR